jgi:hypothetical protein
MEFIMKRIFLMGSLFVFPVLAMNNNNEHGVPTFREIDAVAESNQESCIKEYSIYGYPVPFYTEKQVFECQKESSRRYESFVIINMLNACLGRTIEEQFDFTQPKKDHFTYMNDLEQKLEFSEFMSIAKCFRLKFKIFKQRIKRISERNQRYQ